MKPIFSAWALVGVVLFGAGPARAASSAPCPAQPIDIGRGVEIIHALRAYTGTDGASHVEQTDIKGTTATHMGTVKLTMFDLGEPSRASLVYGFPNVEIPVHPAPGREMFMVLSGSSELRLLDGKTYPLTPGTIFIAEDLGSTGRSGKAGPCGYVAVDFQYKTPVVMPKTP